MTVKPRSTDSRLIRTHHYCGQYGLILTELLCYKHFIKEPIKFLMALVKLRQHQSLLTQVVCLQGKFSELDSTSWTPDLQRALNYDRKSALQIDNGKILLMCAY